MKSDGEPTAGVATVGVITCPACGRETTATMQTDVCQWFWDCPGCGALIRPKPGDCCVFCSYGTVSCPPAQAGDGCCG